MKQNMLAILHGVSEIMTLIMTAMRSLTRSEIHASVVRRDDLVLNRVVQVPGAV